MKWSPMKIIGAVIGAAMVAGLWVFFAPTNLGGSTTYSVTSGISMQPMLYKNDLALVRQPQSLVSRRRRSALSAIEDAAQAGAAPDHTDPEWQLLLQGRQQQLRRPRLCDAGRAHGQALVSRQSRAAMRSAGFVARHLPPPTFRQDSPRWSSSLPALRRPSANGVGVADSQRPNAEFDGR